MPIQSGTHRLGPGNATLRVETGRGGAAAKAGHDLVIDVTSWEATVEVGEDSGPITLALKADGGSLQVLDGTGGVQKLTEEDRVDISKTIDDEVLKGGEIEFRSTGVEASEGGNRLRVSGELEIAGHSHPISFELGVGPGGGISGSAQLKQTDFGMKPYSALFGALKVADEVRVVLEASLAPAS